jgi:hypothetical protein
MPEPVIVGFIVLSQVPGPMHVSAWHSDDGTVILWEGYGATIFPDRASADLMLKNTKDFAARQKLDWAWLNTAYVTPVRNLG